MGLNIKIMSVTPRPNISLKNIPLIDSYGIIEDGLMFYLFGHCQISKNGFVLIEIELSQN